MVEVLVGSQPFQRAASIYVRFSVFVLERDIALSDEFDAHDEKGTVYAVVYEGVKPVSVGRFLPETRKKARLTRIATLKKYRGMGYASKVLQALEEHAYQKGYTTIIIHSELVAKPFYEKHGYQAFGEVYEEDGEICQSLRKKLD
ncbi:GNAT family N-acetyltransferase [Streptococcus cameli]